MRIWHMERGQYTGTQSAQCPLSNLFNDSEDLAMLQPEAGGGCQSPQCPKQQAAIVPELRVLLDNSVEFAYKTSASSNHFSTRVVTFYCALAYERYIHTQRRPLRTWNIACLLCISSSRIYICHMHVLFAPWGVTASHQALMLLQD